VSLLFFKRSLTYRLLAKNTIEMIMRKSVDNHLSLLLEIESFLCAYVPLKKTFFVCVIYERRKKIEHLNQERIVHSQLKIHFHYISYMCLIIFQFFFFVYLYTFCSLGKRVFSKTQGHWFYVSTEIKINELTFIMQFVCILCSFHVQNITQ